MYQYKLPPIFFTAARKKIMVIASLCALLSILFFFTATGNIAVTEEKQTMKERISFLEEARLSCIEILQKKAASLDACSTDLQNCNSLLATASLSFPFRQNISVLNSCNDMMISANQTISQCEYAFEMLVINSAREICCKSGIETTDFTVENYKIKCSGNYKLNCITGKLV